LYISPLSPRPLHRGWIHWIVCPREPRPPGVPMKTPHTTRSA
jgi:hypothetical protein